MKKKLISLLAACSMIATVSVGLVQTVYAAGPTVRIDVTDGATDTEKVLNFYYEGVDQFESIQGYFDLFDEEDNDLVDEGLVTVDSFELGLAAQYQEADAEMRSFYATESRKNRFVSSTTGDGLFATATVTVPGDIDVRVDCVIEVFVAENVDYAADIGTVTVTIPKNESGPVPVEAASQDDYTGTDNSVASLWKATATADNATKATAVATLADGVTTAGGEVELDGTFSGDIEVYVIVNKASAEIQSVAVSFE